MILTILTTVFIFLVAGGVLYAINTYVINAMAKNILLVAAVLGLIVVLLRYFKQI